MADLVELDAEVKSLRVRVRVLEADMRIFTPPVTAVERGLFELRTKLSGFQVEVGEEFAQLRTELNEQFNQVDRRFTGINEQFNQVDRRFTEIDERFNQVDRRFTEIDERFNQVDRRFVGIDERFNQMDQRFDAVMVILREIAIKIGSQSA